MQATVVCSEKQAASETLVVVALEYVPTDGEERVYVSLFMAPEDAEQYEKGNSYAMTIS